MSSGTVPAAEKAGNLPYWRSTLDLLGRHGIREFAKDGYGDPLTPARLAEADLTVCMNQRVYDEARRCAAFPVPPRVWSVADVGEPGRIVSAGWQRDFYREEAYREIVGNVDRLVAGLARGQADQ